jgi:integrase
VPKKLPFEPFIFLRQRKGKAQVDAKWSIVFPRAGKRVQRALRNVPRGPEGEKAAREQLALLKAELVRRARIDEPDSGDGTSPLTVARHAVQWLETRRRKGIATVDRYETQLRLHILPYIGHLRIDAVNIDHIEEVMVAAARVDPVTKDPLFSKTTQLHIYRTMRTMFNRAIPRLITTNPCQIQSDDLPRRDALEEEEWREAAVFTRPEVILILTDPRIPIDRQTFYAVMFLTGMRFGEIAALNFRDVKLDMEPLGQIYVKKSYTYRSLKGTRTGVLKGTKTGVSRRVPVHPWLARILRWWKDHGWAELMGRQPTEDDIVIPNRRGNRRSHHNGWAQMNGVRAKKRSLSQSGGKKKTRAPSIGDLERLGFRNRRQHDSRATFVSFIMDDGGNEGILRWITHGQPKKDAFDLYRRRPDWAAACAEVLKLRLALPSPAPLKSLELHEAGLPSGCHEGEAMEIIRGNAVTPPGIEPRRGSKTQTDSSRQQAIFGAFPANGPAAEQKEEVPEGHSWSCGNLATLALRQALAAIDRGRVDQAREILSRAIEREREGDDDEVAS